MSVAEKKTAKRSKLIDAAFELFTKKGINPTAVDEVVKHAGVAKGTFYLYFRDKYDLLEQMTTMKCTEIVKKVLDANKEKMENPSVSPNEKITVLLDSMIDELSENRSLAILILRDMGAFRKLWSPDYSKDENEIYKKLISIFIDGGCDEETAPKQMYMTFISAASVCCDSILYGEPYTTEEIKPQIHLLVKSFIK